MLAIIPARGGSKGIPRKNIQPLGGRPLVSYVIKTAIASPKIRQVVVSTEDEEIASVARDCGAEVPFLRPMELATDCAPNGSACLHVVDQLAERDGGMVSEFVLIQPTSPFLQVRELTAGIELYKHLNATAVVAVSKQSEIETLARTFVESLRIEKHMKLKIPMRASTHN